MSSGTNKKMPFLLVVVVDPVMFRFTFEQLPFDILFLPVFLALS